MSVPRSIADLGTILGVWAHPDDEAYLSAGLMALARAHGQRVVLVTATAGERGTGDPQGWPPARLAPVRRRELTDSLATLGVHEQHWLGISDGGCDQLPLHEGAWRIEEVLRTLRPDTIITFGADGMTGHPDHRAVSAWTTAAWHATGRYARLWYATVTPEFHKAWGDINDRIGLWADPRTAPVTPAADLAFTMTCDEALLDIKIAALRAHASQTTPLIGMLGEETYRYWWATESFVAADEHHDPTTSD